MKIFKTLLFLFGAILFLGSCSSEKQEYDLNEDVSTFLNVSSVPSQMEENAQSMSRSIAIGTGSSYQIAFKNGDAFGVFPQGGHQVDFPMTIADGKVETSASLVAKGWRTKGGVKYVAYEPFNYENRDASHIDWDFREIQQQTENNTRDHLGKYWFLASDTLSPRIDESGNSQFNAVVFNMGAVIRFQCIVPAKADYIRAMLVAPDPVFATHGYYDLFDTKAPKVDLAKSKFTDRPLPMLRQPFHAAGYTDHVTLDFTNAVSCDPNNKSQRVLTGYFAVPEVEIGEKTVYLYLWDADGNLYVGSKLLTKQQSYLSRGAIQNIAFTNMAPATTLNVKLNDWEKSELCDECKPVAF